MTLPVIFLGLDPGSSLTKMVYRTHTSKLQFLTMEPDVISLPVDSVERHHFSLGTPAPDRNAWLSFSKTDAHCFAVGALAKEFLAAPRLDQLKFERAFYKVLAAIGAIAQREAIDSRFEVQVAMVLPFGEYSKRKPLKQQLEQGLKSFYFRGQRFRGAMPNFLCAPEGGGYMWNMLQQLGEEVFQKKVIVVLMVGHRDVSCLIIRQGSVVQSESVTAALGFATLLDKVVKRTAGQNSTALTADVFRIGSDAQPGNLTIRTLIRSTQTENIEFEAKEIAQAIAIARTEYWGLLKDWMAGVLPARLDYLVIGGGAAQYLKPELDAFLAWACPVWGKPPAAFAHQDHLNHRVADLYYLFNNCFQFNS
jgi:hypothetical protein